MATSPTPTPDNGQGAAPQAQCPSSTAIDLSRMAAYLDGEGAIRIRARNRSHAPSYIELRIGNTDFRLLSWLHKTFGGRIRQEPRSSRQKFYWIWDVQRDSAYSILVGCLPYFVMKRDQAEVAIEFHQLAKQNFRDRASSKEKLFSADSQDNMEKRKDLMQKLHLVRELSCKREVA